MTLSNLNDASAVGSSLQLAVVRLTRRLRQLQDTRDLTLTQLSALDTIWREGPMRAGQLAEAERVRPPSISRVIATLCSLGFVARESDLSDGRYLILCITPAGGNLMQQLIETRESWLSHQLDALEGRDRAILQRACDLINRLAANSS